MTYNEVKSLLRNVRSKKSRLQAIQRLIDEERALMRGVNSINYAAVKVETSVKNGSEDRYIQHLDKLIKWQELFNLLFDEMCQEEDLLAEMMTLLSPTEYEVILNIYMLGLSRRKTADIMNYSEDGIKTIQKTFF